MYSQIFWDGLQVSRPFLLPRADFAQILYHKRNHIGTDEQLFVLSQIWRYEVRFGQIVDQGHGGDCSSEPEVGVELEPILNVLLDGVP